MPDSQLLVLPNKLSAPELLISGRKPVGEVEIDWSHPLAKGCTMFLPLNNELIDLVSGKLAQLQNPTNGVFTVNNRGVILKDTQSNPTGIFIDSPPGIDKGAGSLTIFVNDLNSQHINSRFFQGGGVGYNDTIIYKNGADSSTGFRLDNDTWTGFHSSINSTGRYAITFSWDINATSQVRRIYINKVKVDTSGALMSAAGGWGTILNIFYNGSDTTTNKWGEKECAVFHDRQLSDYEVKSLHSAPYQFLKPKQSPMLLPPAENGAFFSDSRAEMPELLIPGRKPVGSVEINNEDPIAPSKSDNYFLLQNGEVVDSVTGLIVNSTVDNIVYKNGSPYFNGSNSRIDLVRYDSINWNLCAFHTRINLESYGDDRTIIGGDTGKFNIRLRDSGNVIRVSVEGGSGVIDSVTQINVGIDYDITCVIDTNKTLDGVNTYFLYINGILDATSSSTVIFTDSSRYLTLGTRESYSRVFIGTIYFAFFEAYPNLNKILQRANNPYQFLIPT